MNSNWGDEIAAVLAKEWRSEQRDLSASFMAGMLSVSTVFSLAFAFFGRTLSPDAGAGLLWVAILFAGVGTLTRSFVAEDEIGTGDLLRMWARPTAVFWGKFLFALFQMLVTAFVVGLMFITLTGLAVPNLALLVSSLLAGSLALAGLVTLVSALISRGSNRGTLAGVVSLPLLIPLVAMGVTATRGAFDPVAMATGWRGAFGVLCYALLTIALAPHQFAAVWREQD